MKYNDKYPPPNEDEVNLDPPSKFLGLHPLVWVFVVVMGIAAYGAHDHLEHANWDRGSISEEAEHDDDGHEEDDDVELEVDNGSTLPSSSQN